MLDLLFVILSFILTFLLIVCLMYCPQILIILPICIAIIIILFKLLSSFFDNIFKGMAYSIEKKEKNTLSNQELINNLKEEKKINIGEVTIQCKNQTIIINGKKFNVKDIQKVELKYEILNVWKSVLNTYMPIHTSEACYPNAQIEISDYRMTLEQYHKDIALQQEVIKDYNDGKTSSYYPNGRQYQYKFDKNYYLSIQFKDGNHKLFKIAFCPKCDKEILNAPKEEILILELEKYIDDAKQLKESN